MSEFKFTPGTWETFIINGKIRRYYRPYHGSDYAPRPRYGSLKIQNCYDTKPDAYPCYISPEILEQRDAKPTQNNVQNNVPLIPNASKSSKKRRKKKKGLSTLLGMCFAALMLASCAQKTWHRPAAASACAFASGAAWGLHETISHHPNAFLAKFPNANQRFWIPAKSWDRPTVMGYKFDAKHMLASGTQVGAIGCGVFVGIGEKRPFWRYAADLGMSFAAYSAGNFLTYNGFF